MNIGNKMNTGNNMNIGNKLTTARLLAVFSIGLSSAIGLAAAAAADLPVIPSLPTPTRPDGKEADMSKPVQVFILLGQSNMVGMGEVGGDEVGSLIRNSRAMWPPCSPTRSPWVAPVPATTKAIPRPT